MKAVMKALLVVVVFWQIYGKNVPCHVGGN